MTIILFLPVLIFANMKEEYVELFGEKFATLKIDKCKGKQPRGTRFQYWVGVAQIVAGCIAAPFSGGTSAILISMGTATVISAASDCLNNIEDWENELNRRQRISPDNTSYISPNQMTCFSLIVHI